jgi:hypothetical protein
MRRLNQATTTYSCRTCGSINIVKNGTNKCGSPQSPCKEGGAYRVLKLARDAQPDSALVLRMYQEHVRLHGLQRLFHVGRQTVMQGLANPVARLSSLAASLLPTPPLAVLEGDEMGRLSPNASTNAGYGPSSVDARVKLSLGWSVITARRRVKACGTLSCPLPTLSFLQ